MHNITASAAASISLFAVVVHDGPRARMRVCVRTRIVEAASVLFSMRPVVNQESVTVSAEAAFLIAGGGREIFYTKHHKTLSGERLSRGTNGLAENLARKFAPAERVKFRRCDRREYSWLLRTAGLCSFGECATDIASIATTVTAVHVVDRFSHGAIAEEKLVSVTDIHTGFALGIIAKEVILSPKKIDGGYFTASRHSRREGRRREGERMTELEARA
ncbi:uncharacterized protein LOC114255229 [Monomorium pharaonis]|uniref:uncharacterized protein LOC114255229 n=1 Tax=Monomorium pharaonis TaxID=307658 RepID=UPI001746CD35|nr:uncharacterized protein LOC114255229 [Monomorium pharaonis]